MVSWILIPVSLVAGVILGIVVISLVSANGQDDLNDLDGDEDDRWQ